MIDKDRASALLATELGVDLFVISTDSDYVYSRLQEDDATGDHTGDGGEMEQYYAQGQFPAGNMGPKIESALRFLKNGGREVIITSYTHLLRCGCT